jgi:hypothetical protein
MRINEESHNKTATRSHKKMKADESIYKDSACYPWSRSCGADIVIALVLPFLGICGISVRSTLE